MSKTKYLTYLILTLLFFSSGSGLVAQIVDDSTEEKYGVHTVWITQNNSGFVVPDTLFNQQIDTSLNNFHVYDPKLQNFNFYQDLGVFNTANRELGVPQYGPESVFKQLSSNPYTNLGFRNTNSFYKSLSPYSELRYSSANNGNESLYGLYTFNIKPNKNIGVEFRRSRTEKQYPYRDKKQEELTSSTALRIFGSHHSYNNKYHVYLNYRSLNYNAYEQGGYDFKGDTIYYDAYLIYTSTTGSEERLSATSRYEGRKFDLQHYYNFDSSATFGLFHNFSITGDKHKFIDDEIEYDADTVVYYDRIIDSNQTFDAWRMISFKNQVGLHFTKKNLTAEASLHQRNYTYILDHDDSTNTWQSELALQATARYKVKSVALYLNAIQSSTGAFNYQARLTGGTFGAEISSSSRLPYQVYENYVSNHLTWQYDSLKNQNQISIKGHFKPMKSIKIGAEYHLLYRYTYLDSKLNINQLDKDVSVLNPYIELRFQKGIFNVQSLTKFNINDIEILGLPGAMNRTKIYLGLRLFNKVMKTNIGVDVRSYAFYRPYGYSPIVHSFYYQDNFYTPSYYNMDVFANFNVKRLRVFIKGANVLEPVLGWNFETAYYPTNLLNISFGVDWQFFD